MSDILPPVPVVSATELDRRLKACEALTLLDVREDQERQFCHIGASRDTTDNHIPLGNVPQEVDRIREAVGDRALVVYCHHGMRSMVAARWLAGQGLARVENLDGGIDAWSREVDPAVPRYVL